MTNPEPITECLLSVMQAERSPAYLAVDPRGILCEVGGALKDYGLDRLEVGSSAAAQALFLEGLLPWTAEIFLPA